MATWVKISLIWLTGLYAPLGVRAADEPLRISAAISMMDALKQIGQAYPQGSPDSLEFNFGASGQLMSQIQQGAPADVFISAGWDQVNRLRDEHLLRPDSIRVIARNRLVLIVPADAPSGPGSLAALADTRYRRIAIGEPRSVPAGAYAMQVLEHLNLRSIVQRRLVYGVSVRQVLDYVERAEVDAGIVYRTDARAAATRVRIVQIAPEDWHAPIEYPAAIVAGTRSVAQSQRFLDYLAAPAAQRIFRMHGFDDAEPSTRAAVPAAAPDVAPATAPATAPLRSEVGRP